MVLLLAGPAAAQTDRGRGLLDLIDTADALELHQMVLGIYPLAIEHVILRKLAIWRLLNDLVRADPLMGKQIVIAGAGLSPLGLDCAVTITDSRVFELDSANVSVKRQLLNRAAPESEGAITCIEADLADLSATSQALVDSGFDPSRPALWIAEGLLYYMEARAGQQLIGRALATCSHNRAIIEFGAPFDELDPQVSSAIRTYHSLIAKEVGMTDLNHLDLADFLVGSSATAVAQHDASTLETLLRGTARLFPSSRSSTLRLAVLAPMSPTTQTP